MCAIIQILGALTATVYQGKDFIEEDLLMKLSKKKIARRVLSGMLAFLMVLGFMPGNLITANAADASNLASEAAQSIGANPMLARTGALYHDIGKMNNPAFFTENQSSVNPHIELNDEEKSAQIIIKHISDGIAIAKKYGLPEKIQDFIRTHHGDGKTKYFYYTLKNKYPDKVIDESKFTYPGPRPYSKETAILVICDSVEAASRSLKEYNDQNINDLVENIIN